MKKRLLFFLMMMVAVISTMSAQGESEKTMAPEMWVSNIGDSEECVLVTITCGEEAVIHVLVDGEEVMQGENYCEYSIPCLYVKQELTISAYAVASGKLASDTVSELVVVPCITPEAPWFSVHDGEYDPECVEYSDEYGVFFTKSYVTIDNPYDTEVTVLYRIRVWDEQDEPNWGEWTVYDGYDEEGELQHITYETDDPSIIVMIEAYATVNNETESEHTFTAFHPIQPKEKPWWAEFDFVRDSVYYKITSNSTVSVCTKESDAHDYPQMYHGAYFGDVIIPETVTFDNHVFTVTGIDQGAFTNCPQITSVSMPNTITFIGDYAFAGDTSLTSIVIPSVVDSIGACAFEYCTGLTSVTIPNSVKTIGNCAFIYCKGLTSISVNSENTSYDSRDNCNAIIETASNTLITGCRNTIIPGSVTSIFKRAFLGCSGLTSIDIPNSVISIGESAFQDCSALTSADIPNSVTSIGESAFMYCSALTSADIPNSVTSIGESAFMYCSALSSVNIPNSITSIGKTTFAYCSILTSIDIPNSVTSIGERAFEDCYSLTSVIIPNSVTVIGKYAFNRCKNLTSIDIPGSIASIGTGAFYECNFTSVICRPQMPPESGKWALFVISNGDIYDQATLYVPMESLEAYQAHEEWGKFTHIVPFIGAGPGDITGDGSIDVSDVTNVIAMVLENGEAPAYADLNGDGKVDVSDVTMLISIVLNR